MTQDHLAAFHEAEELLKAAQAHYDECLNALQGFVLKGARIQTGKLAPVVTYYQQKHPSYKSGLTEEEARRVYERTEWTPHLRVRVRGLG